MQQEQVDWFESWFGSPYYHILYEHRDELEAQAFVERLLKYLQPLPMSTMADIACGEGRFSIELAEYGYDVTGIDLSSASIEKAKKHEHEHLHFMVHDMRYPFYINYFNYVFNFFTSFGYFATERDHMMAAKSFAAGMKKGGLLIIDYLNKEQSLSKVVPDETLQRGQYECKLERKLEENHLRTYTLRTMRARKGTTRRALPHLSCRISSKCLRKRGCRWLLLLGTIA